VFAEAGLGPVHDWHTSSPDRNVANAAVQLAADFVARTNIDALDVTAINTAERTIGVSPEGSIIPRLRKRVRVPLVLHLNPTNDKPGSPAIDTSRNCQDPCRLHARDDIQRRATPQSAERQDRRSTVLRSFGPDRLDREGVRRP